LRPYNDNVRRYDSHAGPFGEAIATVLRARGWSKSAFARLAKIHPTEVSRYWSGKAVPELSRIRGWAEIPELAPFVASFERARQQVEDERATKKVEESRYTVQKFPPPAAPPEVGAWLPSMTEVQRAQLGEVAGLMTQLGWDRAFERVQEALLGLQARLRAQDGPAPAYFSEARTLDLRPRAEAPATADPAGERGGPSTFTPEAGLPRPSRLPPEAPPPTTPTAGASGGTNGAGK